MVKINTIGIIFWFIPGAPALAPAGPASPSPAPASAPGYASALAHLSPHPR